MTAATIHDLAPSSDAPTRPPLPQQRTAPPRLTLVPQAVPVRRVSTPREPRLQLTRRGRLVALVALLMAGAALSMVVSGLVGGASAGTRLDHDRPHSRTVVVQPGQTLWSIARDVAPGSDRRDTIARIVELNALPSTDVAAGTRLAVPTR